MRTSVLLLIVILAFAAASAAAATSASQSAHVHAHSSPSPSPSSTSAVSNHHGDHQHLVLHHSGRVINQVSVKSYGAVGDGVTDDSSAIMNATAALVASGTSESENVLYFPVGRYLLSGPIPLSLSAYITIPSEAYYHYSVSGVSSEGTTLIWDNSYDSLISWNSEEVSHPGSSLTFSHMTITTANPMTNSLNLWASVGIETVNITDIVYNGLDDLGQLTTTSTHQQHIINTSSTHRNSLEEKCQVVSTNTLTMNSCRSMNGSIFLLGTDIDNINLSNIDINNFGEPFMFETYSDIDLYSTCTINMNDMNIVNYWQGITIISDSSSPTSYGELFQLTITNSYFDATGNLEQSLGNSGSTISGVCLGSIIVDRCTFIDPLQVITHISLDFNNTISITNSTFNGGVKVLSALNGGEFTLSDNKFIGPFIGSSIQISSQGQESLPSIIANNNICQGSNSTMSLLCSISGNLCQLHNNQGC